jgi:hypothetical protein
MKIFSVRMLYRRKRVGIKVIETENIAIAEQFIRELLCGDYFPLLDEQHVVKKVFRIINQSDRKVLLFYLKARNGDYEKFRVSIQEEG